MSDTRTKSDAVSNTLQAYLREIKDEPLLTRAEERTLAEEIASGNSDARKRMIQANLRLVVKIATDYVGRGVLLEDLIGEGNLGLIRATAEFKSRFGTRFSTYASYWIKQSIRHALINTTSTIRLPAHMVGLLTKWRRAERSLYREWGRMPSFDELSTYLGLSETQQMLMAKAQQARQLKLESGIGAGFGRWSPEESASRYEPVESIMEADEERLMLLSRLEILDLRERTVLALRYGLEGEAPLTLKEIGRRLGVTREWVRKIEIRAVHRLHFNEEQDHGDSLGQSQAQPNSRSRRSLPSQVTATKPLFPTSPRRATSKPRFGAHTAVSRRPETKSMAAPPWFR